MTNAWNRRKGVEEERRIAILYRKAGLKNAKRALNQYQESSGKDIEGVEPWSPQVKSGKTISIPKAWKESVQGANINTKDECIPVLHIKYDRLEPLVVIPENVYFNFLRILRGDDE